MKKIKEHMREIMNLISFAAGLGFNLMYWYFKTETSVPIVAFFILATALLITMWLCAKLFFDAEYIKKQPLAIIGFKVIGDELFCMVKKNAILSSSSIVTFYKNEDNFDRYFATGYVHLIQDNGIIQIAIIHIHKEYSELLKTMCDSNTLSKDIIVKNNVTIWNLKELNLKEILKGGL